MRALLGLPLALAVAGCAIPSNDNPHQPSRRPRAELAVSDWSPSGGACPDAAPAPGTSVAVVPIGHCLALDARGSGDNGAVTYRFEGPGLDVTSHQPWIVIPHSARLGLPLGELHTFRLTVRDRSGNESVAEVAVLLENVRPEIRAGIGRSLPEGGYPWALGEPFDVAIPVSASDSDGDRLRLCWSVNQEPESCSALSETSIRLELPVTRARYTLTVRSFDDVEKSLPVFVEVNIGPSPIWLRGAGPLSRLDASWTLFPGVASWHGAATLLEPESGAPVLARSIPGDEVELLTWPSGSPISTLPIGITAGAGSVGLRSVVHTDPDGAGLWIASLEETLGQRVRFVGQRYSVSDGGAVTASLLPATSAGTDYIPDSELGGVEPITVVGSSGALWMARTQGDKVAGLDPSGAKWMCTVTGGSVSGLAKRGALEETWATAYGIAVKATLLRLSRDCVFDEVELPTAVATGLGFIDASLLWIATQDRGVLLLDMEPLLAGDPEGAIVAEFPEVASSIFDGGKMRVDPVTGTFWVPVGGGTWEILVSLTASFHPGYAVASGWDASGRALFTRGDLAVGYGQVPAASGINATSTLAVNSSAALDWSSGGAWARVDVDTTVSGLLRVDRLGNLSEAFSGFEIDGEEEGLPYLYDLAASADGRFLWSRGDISNFTGDPLNLYAIEIADVVGQTLPIPQGTKMTVIGNANVDDITAVLPLAPVNDTAARLAWVLVDETIALLDSADGTTADVRHLLTPPQRATDAGRSLRTNDVCYASSSSGAFPNPATLNLARLAIGASAPSYVVAVTATQYPNVTAASDAQYDACWYAFTNGATHTVRAYTPAGVLLHSFTATAYVSDLSASSAHEVLVNVSGTVHRVRFAPVVGGGVIANDVLVTGSHAFFIEL